MDMGPQTGRDLNTFIASYREHYEPLMEFPMDIVIGVGGKKIRFEVGEEDSFFNTLVSSQEISFMWRNGIDIQALTDMTNMPIEVTLFDPQSNSVENIQTFEPTPNFPWKENDPNKPEKRKYNRTIMKLINYKNLHFNLIVPNDDEIVKMLMPEDKAQQTVSQPEDEIQETSVIEELKKRLKLSEESKKQLNERLKLTEESKNKLVIDHKEAMKEVGRMKEQVEKLKIELKTVSDYKSMLRNENPISAPLPLAPSPLPPCTTAPEAASLPTHQSVQQPTAPPAVQEASQPASLPPAPWTTVNRKSPRRTGAGSETNQRNCPKCYFQSDCKEEMEKHLKMSHLPKGDTSKVVIRTERIACRNCKVEFQNYWSLMNHRRDNHLSDKACRYDLEDRCKHTADDCWYEHKNGRTPNKSSKSQINYFDCSDCNMKFKNKHELMMHKKVAHVEQCKPCEKYIKDECSREDTCWYPHIQDQGFHQNYLNTRPQINQVQ